jgi:glucose/mannose-6-phosphate isomerase
MMKELILKFPAQLKEAVNIAGKASLNKPTTPIKHVLICGLGGSGIGGTLVREIVNDEMKVPIDVMKSYSIPAYVDASTLVICSSYSGNTEETLESYKLAKSKKAQIVCITSGGALLEMAKKDGYSAIVVPSGMPPRACLGYSLTQLFHVLAFYGICPEHVSHMASSAALLEKEQAAIMKEADAITDKIAGKLPVIYSTSLNEGVIIRFRQQLNENAKILCWHNVFPEMNHNELVGWSHEYPEIAVMMFIEKEEHPRNQLRIEICRKIFQKYAGLLMELYPKGNHPIEKKMYWIHLGDWVSYLLSEKRNVDAMDIKVIDQLKKELASR